MSNIIMDLDTLNALSYRIIGAVYRVHTNLGPGLLESAYETCLTYELRKDNMKVTSQETLPVIYAGVKLDAGYRLDLLVENSIILELKAVEELVPIHTAQLITYLKLSKRRLGLLLNFNVKDMKKGINRLLV